MLRQRDLLQVCFVLTLSMAAVAVAEESGDEGPRKGYVKVELSDLVPPKPPETDYKLMPYGQRRPRWGNVVGLGVSSFAPTQYAPNFTEDAFGDIYGNAQTPLIEFQYTLKRNLSLGSLGAELGVGYYKNSSTDVDINSELSLYQLRIGAIFVADMLFKEPWVAPYASAGAYVMQFKEALGSTSYNGITQVAPYVNIGVQAGLDWIDRIGATRSYMDSGIQATHVFAEARKYFLSGDAADPDFETSFQFGGGVRVEF